MGHYFVSFNGLVDALQVPGNKAEILILSCHIVEKLKITSSRSDVSPEPKGECVCVLIFVKRLKSNFLEHRLPPSSDVGPLILMY